MKAIHPFRTGSSGYGLERNILCSLPGLVEEGVETVALAVTEERSGPIDDRFRSRLEGTGVKVITICTRGRLPFGLGRTMSEVFEEEQPDVVHSHGYKCDLAMMLADTADAVRMTTVHGWCSRTRKERFYEWLQVRCGRRMDAVVVFCDDYKRRLTRRGVSAELVHVAPVGLNSSMVPSGDIDFRERWGVPPDGLLVVQVGRLSREKRPDLFVRAASELEPDLPSARFVLVGDGPLRPELESHPGPVRCAGYVREMADVWDGADIAVNCSTTEALPRTLLEAGAAGVPAVAASVGGIPDVVIDGETGLLCPPDDASELVNAIRRLATDAGLRSQMGRAAKERVETVFSVAACSRKLVALYRSLLEERGGAEQ